MADGSKVNIAAAYRGWILFGLSWPLSIKLHQILEAYKFVLDELLVHIG